MQKPIIGYTIQALKESMLDGSVIRIAKEFTKERELDSSVPLTPDLKQELAQITTDFIMKRATEQRASEEKEEASKPLGVRYPNHFS